MSLLSLIQAFEREKVSYVVVGGVAVVLHGHGRLTTDLDMVVQLTPENTAKVVEILAKSGFKPRAPVDPKQFTDPNARKSWIDQKGLQVFSFFNQTNPLFEVDLFVDYPMEFEGLLARSVCKDLGGIMVRIAGLDDIISMKKKAGRPQDLEDARILEAIRNAQ